VVVQIYEQDRYKCKLIDNVLHVLHIYVHFICA